MTDMTVNTSGEANMCPPVTLKRTGETDLIDGFIKDGWIRPGDREKEIAWVYQGQRDAARRDYRNLLDDLERRRYADGWVARWLEDHA